MGVEVEGIEDTLFQLRRITTRTNKAELEALRTHSKKMLEAAKNYAPVDEGNLERAIKMEEIDRGTLNGRVEVMIGVDESELGQGYWVYGERYDLIMHEGGYKLGAKSERKQERLGVVVGPKYLTRAFQDHLPDLEKEMREIIQRAYK